MKTLRSILGLAMVLLLPISVQAASDWRNIETGTMLPDENYCDQPYVVITRDGHWLCVMTTGKGIEGQLGQHVVATISEDQGKSWSPLIDIEPADGPEASWVVPLVVPSGRVYAFYDYNGDEVRKLNGQPCRADMLGWYVYKYSDDNGRTWSKQRYRLPVRFTEADRDNGFGGKVQIFWGICKPMIVDDAVYFAFTKIGQYMLDDSEGWVFKSNNILTESDPEKIEWEMLPTGDGRGIRSPKLGSIQAEHNLVYLANGDLYCMYRTTTGYPAHCYSRDGGRSWSMPVQATYTPDGRRMKNPRACPKVWRLSDGRFLFWFHNHSGRTFDGRNPAWLTAGREIDGKIHWCEPEILFYQADDHTRMSYPDLVEVDGQVWITETNKSAARIHKVPADFLDKLLNQYRADKPVAGGLVLDTGAIPADGAELDMPRLPDLSKGGGFSIDCWLTLPEKPVPGQVVLDSRSPDGKGLALSVGENDTLVLTLCDGSYRAQWDTDAGVLLPGQKHHVVFTVDGGPRIITAVVDGTLCDGGEQRQYGWGRFARQMADVTGGSKLKHIQSNVAIDRLRIYNRPLMTSEAVANHRAGSEK